MEKYNGQILTEFSYLHDTTYSKLLIRAADSLEANTKVTSQTQLTGAYGPSYGTTTFEFILARNYKYLTQLDGVIRGSLEIKTDLQTEAVYLHTAYTSIYVVVSLIARTSAGVDTTLATTTTTEFIDSIPGATARTYNTHSVPFFVDVFNKSIPNGSKLILKLVCYLTINNSPYPPHQEAYLLTALNTSNVFVEVPIVP